jgi:hypothetical protein
MITPSEINDIVIAAFIEMADAGLAKTATLRKKVIGAYTPSTQSQVTSNDDKTVYVLKNKAVGEVNIIRNVFGEINWDTEAPVLIATNQIDIDIRDLLIIDTATYYFTKMPREISLDSNAVWMAMVSDKQIDEGNKKYLV